MSNKNFSIAANEMADVISVCYNAKRTPLFIGRPGIGKTAMVREAAAQLSLQLKARVEVYELHLASVSEVDIRGYLIPDGQNARFTKPSFWSVVEANSHGILFLDEFVQAPHEVQKAVAPLIYEGRIGDYTLPAGWSVVLAGNGLEDGAGANTLLSHVVNRLSIIDVRAPTPDEWSMWAINAGLEPEIIALANFRPDVVFASEIPKTPDTPYCSARSLHAVSDVAKHYPGGLRAMVESRQGMALMAGLIGEGAVSELVGFIRQAMNLPSFDDIVKHPDTTPVPEKPDMKYAMVMLAAVRCTIDTAHAVGTYLARFDPNFTVTGMVAMCRRDQNFVANPAVMKWVMANQPLLTKYGKYISMAA